MENHLILGIDAGNHRVKIAGLHGVDSFKSNICGWFERDIKEQFGNDDMEFQVGNRKGFAGTIAQFEDEFGDGTTYGDSKAHEDTKIRILLGIYRYMLKFNLQIDHISIITGQPIKQHKESEKNKISEMLIDTHEFTVNNSKVKFTIDKVGISPEGSGAFWSNPVNDAIRIIDVGSGTVNMATISDRRHIHKSSGTMNTGIETLRNKNDYEAISRAIFQQATKLKWNKNDTVYVCGGVTLLLLPFIQNYFVNVIALQPKLKREYDTLVLEPTYANAVGFYNIAKGVFK